MVTTEDEQERNRIIALIAEKNNVLLSPDDPLLIILTLHTELVSRLANSEEEIINRFSSRIEEVSARWSRDATIKAEKILSASLTSSANIYEQRLQDATTIAVGQIEAAAKRIAKQNEATTETLKKSLYVVLGSVGCVLVASALVLLSSLTH